MQSPKKEEGKANTQISRHSFCPAFSYSALKIGGYREYLLLLQNKVRIGNLRLLARRGDDGGIDVDGSGLIGGCKIVHRLCIT